MSATLYAAVKYPPDAKPQQLYRGTDREQAQEIARQHGAKFLTMGAWGWQT